MFYFRVLLARSVVTLWSVCFVCSLRDFLVASLHQYQKIQATKETLGQGDEEELEDSQAGASL